MIHKIIFHSSNQKLSRKSLTSVTKVLSALEALSPDRKVEPSLTRFLGFWREPYSQTRLHNYGIRAKTIKRKRAEGKRAEEKFEFVFRFVTMKAMLANNKKRNPQQHKLNSKARKFSFLILRVKTSLGELNLSSRFSSFAIGVYT